MHQKSLFSITVVIVLAVMLIVLCGCKKSSDDEPVSNKSVWVVGGVDSTNYGMILYSPDGGETWQRQGEGTSALEGVFINDVWAIDENTVWAVGVGNVILKTRNGGVTWNRVTAPVQRDIVELVSISIVDRNDIWISGSPGIIYHSFDGGDSWSIIQSPIIEHKYLQGIHAINSDVIYTTGGHVGGNTRGFIARTLDGGQTWDSIVPSDNFNKHLWIGVASSDINSIIVYGGASYFIHSSDGGQSWVNDSVPNTGGGGTGGADINCLKMLDSQTWWGAFDLDAIFLTEDAGGNWEKQGPAPPPGNMWLLGLDYYNHDLCVIVGSSESSNYGKIIQTIDRGKKWEKKLEAKAWLNKVSFIKK